MKRTKSEMPVGQPGRQRSKAKKAKAPLSARLRRRAEERLRRQRRGRKPGAGRQGAGADMERVVHDLHVHQIELEMQNEELRRAQHELEVSREKYFDLYDLAPVGYLTLNEPGLILEANLTAARLLGVARKDLVRQPLTRFILREDLGIFYQHRQPLFETGAPQSCELRLTRPGGAPFWVRGEAILAQDHKTGAPVCRVTLSDITTRKQADETLTRQLEILNATPDFIGFADARDTRILYINPAGRKMIGWGAEEDVTRLKMAEVHPAWTNRLFREEILPIAIRDGVWKGDAAFLHRDGREIPVTMVLLAHKSPGGKVERFSTISRDLTERKQAEADRERLAQFERLAQLMKCANDIILLADEHGRIIEANDRALETYGYSLAELRQKTVEDLRTPASRAELPQHAEQLEMDGRAMFEAMHQRRDGVAFPVEISARFLEIAGVRHQMGIVRDLTERKRAEEEAQSLGKFPSENPNPVLRIARDGTLLYINQAGLSLLSEWHAQAGQTAPPILREVAFQTLDDGSMQVLELEYGEKVYAFDVAPIVAAGYSNLYGRDITERKRTEKKMQMFSQEIITAREEERKRVSSVLHHDVGSLTVGISSHFDAIEQDLRSGKPGEALQWMKRTRKLFDESVARLKQLAIELRPPELDVIGLRAALRQHFSQVTERGCTQIHFRETLGRRRVSGDTATILFRVAQEAVTNAITHGHATRVDVGLRASKEEVRLTVRNNGKGFNPSEQRTQATSQIGLRVMHEMAVSAGGTFTIDSGRGKRTTVRMRLPLSRKPQMNTDEHRF